jgi:hypothetical protein
MGVEIEIAHEYLRAFEGAHRGDDLFGLFDAVGMVALSKIANPHAVQIRQMNAVSKRSDEHFSAMGAFVSFGKTDSRVVEIDGSFEVRTDSNRMADERSDAVVVAVEIRETVFEIGKEFAEDPDRVADFARVEDRVELVVAGVAHHFLKTKSVDLAPQAFDEFENGGIHPASPDVERNDFHILFSFTVSRKNDFDV